MARQATVRQARTQQTKERLLEAAINLINERGVKEFTVRNVCERAGLTTGSFYNLFNGKDDLIAYYITYTFSKYKSEAAFFIESLEPLDKVKRIYRFFAMCCEDAGVEFTSVYYSISNPVFDFRHRLPEHGVVLEEVREYLTAGQKDGSVRTDIEMDEVLMRIGAIVTGLLFYWCVFKGEMDIERQMDEVLSIYLDTLRSDIAR